MADYGNYQTEMSFAGLSGVVPDFPMDFAGWETRAAHALPPSVLSYVAGGAGDGATQRGNGPALGRGAGGAGEEAPQRTTVAAFARWGLMPRMFVGATKRDLSVQLFGLTLPSPLFMAPVGVIGLCCQDGH